MSEKQDILKIILPCIVTSLILINYVMNIITRYFNANVALFYEQLDEIEKLNHQLQQRYAIAVREVDAKDETIRQFRDRLSDMQIKQVSVSEEVCHKKLWRLLKSCRQIFCEKFLMLLQSLPRNL